VIHGDDLIIDDVLDPGVAEADEAALRALLTRLRGQIADAEAQAYAEWQDLRASVSNRDSQEEFQATARAVARRQSAAASELQGLADELRVMADSLHVRQARPDLRIDALVRMAAEIGESASQLAFRVAEGQSWAREAMGRFTERLEKLESAATDRSTRQLERLAVRIEESEARRGRELSDFVDSLERRRAKIAATARSMSRIDTSPAPPVRRSNHKPAAALLSAGVACLGFVTLAVVTAPTPQGQRALEIVSELVMRGRILIAPPRVAQDDEPAAKIPEVRAPGVPVGAAAEQALDKALADLKAGRVEAVARLRSLAEAGMPRAQMQMAQLYEAGQVVPADRAEARRWTARAADAGNPVAMHNLAIYYLEGRGGPRDDVVATRLLRRAATAGLADSQFNLAMLYEAGDGVDRNLVEAYKWFQIAANNGDLKARSRAMAIEARLSPREVASADRTAQGFTPGQAVPEEPPLIAGTGTVAEAQRRLARLGYYIGPTDGQDGPAYRQAVEAYRRDQQAQVASARP
jgi:localization factor PodJL